MTEDKKMIITLNDDYRIRVETLNFVLQERHVSKAGKVAGREIEGGKETWKTLGYYSGLESVLMALPDHLAQSESVTTLHDYLDRWRTLAKDIGGKFSK